MHAHQGRPFRLLGDSAILAVRAALVQAACAWASDWGLAPALADVGVRRAWDSASDQGLAWNQGAQADGRRTWLAVGADFGTGLQQAMFADDPGYAPAASPVPSVAPAGARQALDALLDALVRTSLASQQNLPRGPAAVAPEHWKRGSGALVARLAIGGRHCHLLLDAGAVQALLPTAAPLASLAAVDVEASVSEVPVSLRLDGGAARVGLAALLSLAPGDVIRLDRHADAPLALHTLSGRMLFAAYLGKHGNSVAVELTHHHPVGEVQ